MLRRVMAFGLVCIFAFTGSFLSQGCSSQPSTSDTELYDVTFAQNRFLAVGTRRVAEPGTYQALLLTSNDGQSWNPLEVTLPNPPTSYDLLAGHVLRGVVYGNGVYLAAGGSHKMWKSSLLLISKDGTRWSEVEQDLQGHLR